VEGAQPQLSVTDLRVGAPSLASGC
jgi:hypothetical protein